MPGSTQIESEPRPACAAGRHARGEEAVHFGHDVVVLRRLLHGRGLAVHVHDAHGRVAGRRRGQRPGQLQGAHVIDHVGARLQRRGDHLRLAGVDREQRPASARPAPRSPARRDRFLPARRPRPRPAASTRRRRRRWPHPRLPCAGRPRSQLSRAKCRPPSEKESGVTLRMPMTAGTERSRVRVRQRMRKGIAVRDWRRRQCRPSD